MGKWTDLGIGAYEYHGDKGTDINRCFVSECCEYVLMKWNGSEVDPKAP